MFRLNSTHSLMNSFSRFFHFIYFPKSKSSSPSSSSPSSNPPADCWADFKATLASFHLCSQSKTLCPLYGSWYYKNEKKKLILFSSLSILFFLFCHILWDVCILFHFVVDQIYKLEMVVEFFEISKTNNKNYMIIKEPMRLLYGISNFNPSSLRSRNASFNSKNSIFDVDLYYE